jgi:hypothetical protein
MVPNEFKEVIVESRNMNWKLRRVGFEKGVLRLRGWGIEARRMNLNRG